GGTTIQVTYASGGTSGSIVEASTASDFSGVLITTQTSDSSATSLIDGAGAQALAVDTTYYLRVGALFSGTTVYSATLSTVTLTDLVQNVQIYQVLNTSITVNWTPLGLGEGYLLQASTYTDFTTIAASSQTASLGVSTLTVQNLTSGVVYYLRV